MKNQMCKSVASHTRETDVQESTNSHIRDCYKHASVNETVIRNCFIDVFGDIENIYID